MLSLRRREADIVSIYNVPFVARNEAGLDPAGGGATPLRLRRAPPQAIGIGDLDIESSPYFIVITDDAERRAGECVASRKTGISVDVLRDHPNVLIGSDDAVVEVLQARREELRRQLRHRPAAADRERSRPLWPVCTACNVD